MFEWLLLGASNINDIVSTEAWREHLLAVPVNVNQYSSSWFVFAVVVLNSKQRLLHHLKVVPFQ